MAELTTEQKLKRLEQLEQANRDRSKQYLEKHIESGKKQVSGLITEQAYNELCRRRDAAKQAGNPSTSGDIISAALLEKLKNFDLPPAAPDPDPDTPQISAAELPTGKEINEMQLELFGDDTAPAPDHQSIIDNFILDRHKKGGRGGDMSLRQIGDALEAAKIKSMYRKTKWSTGGVDTAFKNAIKRQIKEVLQ